MRVVKNLNHNLISAKWNTPLSNYACAVRPVAAIMVTKIDGFKALAESDQAASLSLLTKSHRLQEYYFKQYKSSRIVKMGDTIIVSFSSTEKAIACAIKIERSARTMFNHKLSIGIHLGEVRMVENDLFGTPLNIASDIQQMAEAGQILVSGPIADAIDHDDYQLDDHSLINELPVYEVSSRTAAKCMDSYYNRASASIVDYLDRDAYAMRMVSGSY